MEEYNLRDCESGFASDDEAGAGDYTSGRLGEVGTHDCDSAPSKDGERTGEGEHMCALADVVAAAAAECGRTLTFAYKEEAEVVGRGNAHVTDVTADKGACAAAVLTTDEDTAVGAGSDCVYACTAATRTAEFRAGWADARSASSE